MSTIDELIARYCPNGVEYVRLGELCDIKTGKLNANAQDEDGIYPFFTCDINPSKINSYAFDGEAILISGNGNVGHVNYYIGKFNAYQRTYVLMYFSRTIVKYIVHYLKSYLRPYVLKNCKVGAVPYITLPMLQDFLIPIPPLEVQEEIVRILDNMENLTLKLQEELDERKRQFEYYREELLIEKGISNYSLEELCEPVRGRIDVCELDESNYVGVDNLLPNKSGKVLATSIPENGVCIRYEKNDILVGNIRPYLKKIWFADNGGGTNGDVLVYRIKKVYQDKVMPLYLYYILSSDDFFNYDNRYAKGGKMPRGDKRKNLEYSLYIPDLKSEQERIVSILDNMVSLQDKLQAEIDERKRQFEYYREKLLNFERI